jgi:SPX domain protein involved in polyphosphate accumulation
LERQLAAVNSKPQLNDLHKQFVDFHGEVLLLMHWSILAYTATVKILKKHHKRTGLLVRAPQLGNLLSQPFCSTEVGGCAT